MAIYKKIEEFVDDIFINTVMNKELQEQKDELKVNMSDRFNELLESGLSEEGAFNKVIEVFGSPEEIRESFGITIKSKKRYRTASIFIVIVLIIGTIIGARSYFRQREYLVDDLFTLANTLNQFQILAVGAEIPDSDAAVVNTFIKSLSESNDFLIRDMNYFEKRKNENSQNGLFLNYSIYTMHQILVDRKTYGYWSDLDQEVYERYIMLTEALLVAVEDEAHRIVGLNKDESGGRYTTGAPSIFAKLFNQFDVEIIADYYRQLNELATCYAIYNELPENVEPMSGEEIIASLQEKFGADIEVKLPANVVMNNVKAFSGTYNVDIVIDGLEVSATIDCVNAGIKELYSFTGVEDQTEMNNVYVIDLVETLVHQVFDKNLDYKIIYLESSDRLDVVSHDVYAYQVVPIYKAYEVFYQHLYPEVYISRADNRHILLVLGENLDVTTEDFGTTTVVFNEYEAFENMVKNQNELLLDLLGDDNKISEIEYLTTGYVYSHLTSNYDLVHIYKIPANDRLLYINAETGKIE